MKPARSYACTGPSQRPKAESYGGEESELQARLFIVTRALHLQDGRLHNAQVSIFLGHKTVLTFLEAASDVWDPILLRLKSKGSRLRASDASYLGSVYGLTVSAGDEWACADIAPTVDGSVEARPAPDGMVEFEDLILLAINYGAVSGQQARAERVRAATGPTELSLRVPSMPAPGEIFEAQLWLSGGGGVHGLSAPLAFNPMGLEPIAVEAGELLRW